MPSKYLRIQIKKWDHLIALNIAYKLKTIESVLPNNSPMQARKSRMRISNWWVQEGPGRIKSKNSMNNSPKLKRIGVEKLVNGALVIPLLETSKHIKENDGGSVLLATDGVDSNVWRSARNIAGVRVLPAEELNAWDLLRHRKLVVTVAAMDQLLGRVSAAAV